MPRLTDRAWSPYVAGVLIGLLQIPAFLLLDTALGASSSHVTVGASLAEFADPGVRGLQYAARHLDGAKNWWQVALVGGIALGALVSSFWSGTRRRGVSPAWGRALGTNSRLARFVLAFVALWGLRLAVHLALRQRGAKEDARYVVIMKGARGRHETLYALRMIYGLQGLLLWFVSIPLQWIAFRTNFDWLLVPGLVLVTIGFLFEATGDEQLRAFVANPATKGTTLRTGLWRYTRHPNYFGDAVVWCGFYVVACSSGWGCLTVLSPLAMLYLLTSLSGKPMLERKLTKTRAGYDEYVATTSSFFPWPPRRAR